MNATDLRGEFINASEALYGFCGWLTTQKEPLTLGGDHDCAAVADAITKFCETNNLPETREGWEKNLTHPV